MKKHLIYLFFLVSTALFNCDDKKAQTSLSGQEVIDKSIEFHDPNKLWSKTILNLHIQEPRVYNPERFTKLYLDNSKNGKFELSRNRGKYLVTYTIDNNESFILVDGKKDIDSSLVREYNLIPSENIEYKEFYQFMYGLPMSLKNMVKDINTTDISTFSGNKCYRVKVQLNKEVISKSWYLYISMENFELLGLELINIGDPEKNEQLIFDDTLENNGIKIPRIRHWYEGNDTYLGSDIILKKLPTKVN